MIIVSTGNNNPITSLKIDELTKLKLSRSVICQVNNDRLVSYDRGLPVVLVTLAIQLPRLVASLAQPQPHQLLISALVHKQLLYRTPVQLCSSKGLYTPSEKRACNSHSDSTNIEIFQRY